MLLLLVHHIQHPEQLVCRVLQDDLEVGSPVISNYGYSPGTINTYKN